MTVVAEVEDARRWFVVTTHWRQEKVALENLERQKDAQGRPLFEAYLPMHEQLVRPRGQPERVVSLPFFPRYLFVAVDVGQPRWTAMYSTRGVCGVIPSGRHATKVIERLVADMRASEVLGFLRLSVDEMPCPWKPGDKVSYGVFRDVLFCERVDERRCRILVSVLGVDSAQVVDLHDLRHSGGT
jgi:transcriptional antiterminator RfaH